MNQVTVRQARSILFSINSDKADILRKELFNVQDQDQPLTGDLLDRLNAITRAEGSYNLLQNKPLYIKAIEKQYNY